MEKLKIFGNILEYQNSIYQNIKGSLKSPSGCYQSVQDLLSSVFPIHTVIVKTYVTIKWAVVLCGSKIRRLY